METKLWLANKLGSSESHLIDELYKNHLGLDFLLVWTIFESSNFTTNYEQQLLSTQFKNKFENMQFLSNNFQMDLIPLLDDNIFNHFKNRYLNDNSKLLGLCNKNSLNHCSDCHFNTAPKTCEIFKIIYSTTPTKKDKILFLIYVVSRYRNNMFHGSKEFIKWTDSYFTEINYCIDIMKFFTKLP